MPKQVDDMFGGGFDDMEFFPMDDFGLDTNDSKDITTGKYIKNSLKSVSKLALKIASGVFPEGATLLTEMTSAATEVKDQVVSLKDKAMDKVKGKGGTGGNLSLESIGKEATDIMKDLKAKAVTAIKTGDFIQEKELDFGDMFGDDMFGDSSSSSSGTDATPTIEKEEKDPDAPKRLYMRQQKLEKAKFAADNKRFQNLIETQTNLTEATLSANTELFKKAQLMDEARHHVQAEYLKNIAINMYKNTSIGVRSFSAQVEYGKKSMALQAELIKLIQQTNLMLEPTYKAQKAAEEQRKKVQESAISKVFGMGFSGSAFGENIINNAKDAIMMSPVGMMLGMLPMMTSMSSMMPGPKKGALGTALSFLNLPGMLMNSFLDGKFRHGKDRLNKQISMLPFLMNQKIMKLGEKGGMWGFISDLLGVKDKNATVKVEDYSNMKLNQQAIFDVRTYRTINEVIPGLLSQIAAGVTGTEETRYDFKTQTFKTISSIQNQIKRVERDSMFYDEDFGSAARKIHTHAAASTSAKKLSPKQIQTGVDAIHMTIARLPDGFDFEKLASSKSYRERILAGVKGTEFEKTLILRAFIEGYSQLSQDERAFYRAGALATNVNMRNSVNREYENIMENYSGGGSMISSMTRKDTRDDRVKEIQRIEQRLITNYGSIDAAYKRKEAANILAKRRSLQRELEEFDKRGGIGTINAATISAVDDPRGSQLEKQYMTVPNLLKTIHETLLNGIIVYPQAEMPKEVWKYQTKHRRYMKSTSLKAEQAIKDQLKADEESQEEAVREAQRLNEYKRGVLYEHGGFLSDTVLGKQASKIAGHLLNSGGKVVSFLGGFDGNYNYLEGPEGYESSVDKDKTMKQWAKKYLEEAQNDPEKQKSPKYKFAKAINAMISTADNLSLQAFDKLESTSTSLKDEMLTSAIGKEAVQRAETVSNSLKDKIISNTKVQKYWDKFVSFMKGEVDDGRFDAQAKLIDDDMEYDSRLTPTLEQELNQIDDPLVPTKFKGKMSSKSKTVVKSKNVNKAKLKQTVNAKLDIDLMPVNDRLDKIINILEERLGKTTINFTIPQTVLSQQGRWVIEGMDELIAAIVSSNRDDYSESEMDNIEKEIKTKKKGFLSKGFGAIFSFRKRLKNFKKESKEKGFFRATAGLIGGVLGGALGSAKDFAGNLFGKFFKKKDGEDQDSIFSRAKGFLGRRWEQVKGLFGTGKEKAQGLFSTGKEKITSFFGSMKEKLTGLPAEIKELIKNGEVSTEVILKKFSRDTMLKMVVKIRGGDISDYEKFSNEELAQIIKEYLEEQVEKYKNKGKGALENIKGLLSKAKDKAKELGGVVKDKAKYAWDTSKGVVSNLLNKVTKDGINLPGISIGGFGGGGKGYQLTLLANVIGIRTLLEKVYETPADMAAALADSQKAMRSNTGIISKGGKLLSQLLKGGFNLLKKGAIRGVDLLKNTAKMGIYGTQWAYSKIRKKDAPNKPNISWTQFPKADPNAALSQAAPEPSINEVITRAGFVDRGDGSGIREGSYLDKKKDREEREKREREEKIVEYLESIDENTRALAIYFGAKRKEELLEDDEEGGGFNLYNALDMLPGRDKNKRKRRNRRNAGNRANNKRLSRNSKRLRLKNKNAIISNATNITQNASKVSKFGKVFSGGAKVLGGLGILGGAISLGSTAMNFTSQVKSGNTAGAVADLAQDGMEMAGSTALTAKVGANAAANGAKGGGIIAKFCGFFQKIFQKFLSHPKVAKLVGKGFGPKFLNVFFQGIKKYGGNMLTRLTSCIASLSISAGTIAIAQAVAGFLWGFARAKKDFPDAEKITLPMRLTSGMVKALDFLAFGIPGMIFDMMGMNLTQFIYSLFNGKGSDAVNQASKEAKAEAKAEQEQSDQTQGFADSLWGKTKSFAGKIGDKMKQGTDWVIDKTKNPWNKGKDLFNKGKDGLKKIGANVMNFGKDLWGKTKNLGSKAYQGTKAFLTETLPTTVAAIKEKFKKFVGKAKSTVNIEGLRPVTQMRLAGLAEDYHKLTGKKLIVNSGKRTMEDQQKLYDAYLAGKGNLAAKPNPYSPHIAGVAIDVNTTEVDRMLNAGLLDKWGWYRAAYRPDVPHGSKKSESWHLEVVGSRNPSSATLTGWGAIGQANLDQLDAFGQQMMTGNYAAVQALANQNANKKSGPEDPNLEADSALGDLDPSQLDMLEAQDQMKQLSEEMANMSKAAGAGAGAMAGASTGSQSSGSTGTTASSTGSTSSSSGSSASSAGNPRGSSASIAGVDSPSNMTNAMSDVSQLVEVMSKVEENTRKSTDLLAQYLPVLNTMVGMLATINASILSKGSGGSSFDINSAMLAKGH